jgi:hypothetical protein
VLGSIWETTSSVFVVDPTKTKDESLQSVFISFTGHDIRSRDVDTHGTAGPQVQGRSASYRKSYVRSFSAGSCPKPSDLAEN